MTEKYWSKTLTGLHSVLRKKSRETEQPNPNQRKSMDKKNKKICPWKKDFFFFIYSDVTENHGYIYGTPAV